jgi:hypothetical protein
MNEELRPPRECIVDLALLLESTLDPEEDWCTGDQVMDFHSLKGRLNEKEVHLDETLRRITPQGMALVLTSHQRKNLQKDLVGLIGVCMNLLQASHLLDPEHEL